MSKDIVRQRKLILMVITLILIIFVALCAYILSGKDPFKMPCPSGQKRVYVGNPVGLSEAEKQKWAICIPAQDLEPNPNSPSY